MRLVERLNTGVVSSMLFQPESPRSIWYDIYDQHFSLNAPADVFVAVFDQEPATFFGDAIALMAKARYVGRPVRALNNGFELMSMPGMYGPPGVAVREAANVAGPTGQAWSWFRTNHIRHGEVALSANPAGTFPSGFPIGTPSLEILSAAANHFGVFWRLDRLGRFVWSTVEADVFPTTPALAVLTDALDDVDSVGSVLAVRGSVTGFASSVLHHSSFMNSQYTGGTSQDLTRDVGFALNGDPWQPSRFIDLTSISDATTAANLTTAANGRYDPADGPQITFELSVPAERSPADLRPGQTIWAFGPEFRLEKDSTLAAVDVAGAKLRPRQMFVTGIDAPSHRGMCVAVYHAGTGEWQRPISEYVQLEESGPARILFDTEIEAFDPLSDSGVAQQARSFLREWNSPAVVTQTATVGDVNVTTRSTPGFEAVSINGGSPVLVRAF